MLELKIFFTCTLMIVTAVLTDGIAHHTITKALFFIGLAGVIICSLRWIWF